jgi:hypothetical protein
MAWPGGDIHGRPSSNAVLRSEPMGMFRSVQMDLSCERCGVSHPTEVQFKADDDWCQIYAAGDRVDDLPAGEEWQGIADRFCRPCREDHRAERERAAATVLARRVEAGKLVLMLPQAEAPLTADEILARGEEQAEAARRSTTLYGLTLVLTDFWFLDRDGAWLPTHRARTSWWPGLRDTLSAELHRRGWPAGDDIFREDLVVHLDQDGRIGVCLIER